METNFDTFYNDVVDSLQNRSLAIFAGAGLSVSAGFVDWKNLLRDIAADLGVDIDHENDLIRLAQRHVDQIGGRSKLNDVIAEKIGISAAITENHKILARLNVDVYWTTNFDHLIEESIKRYAGKPDVKHDKTQLAISVPGRTAIVYKMHGDLSIPHETVITSEDFANYESSRGAFIDFLRADLMQKRFIFVGISFTDPNILGVLDKVNKLMGTAQRHHWYFIKRIGKDDQEGYERRLDEQNAFVEKLKQYKLRPVWINSYDEITTILQEIESRLTADVLKTIDIIKDTGEYDYALANLVARYPNNTALWNKRFWLNYHSGNLDVARKCVEALCRLEPDNPLFLNMHGALLHNNFKEYTQAERLFKAVLLKDDNCAEFHVNMANASRELSKNHQARYHYEVAIRLDNKRASAYGGLGIIMMEEANYTGAEESFLKAIEFSDKEVSYIFNLAQLYHRYLHRLEEARERYEQALQLAPHLHNIHLNYGLLLLNHLGRPDEAREHFEKAIKLDMKDARGPWFLARALRKNDTDPIGERNQLRDAVDIDPANATLYTELGTTQMNKRIGNWEKAKECFEKALELNPADWVARRNLSVLYEQYIGDRDKAKEVLRQGTSLENGSVSALFFYHLGHIATNEGDYENCIRYSKEAVQLMLSESEGDRFNLLAFAYYNLGQGYWHGFDDYREAQEYFERAIDINPDFADAYSALAAIYCDRLEDYEKAKAAAEAAIRLGTLPSISMDYFNLGVILGNMNSPKEAAAAFEKALEINPDMVDALNQLMHLYLETEDYSDALSTYYRIRNLGLEVEEVIGDFFLAHASSIAVTDHHQAIRLLEGAIHLDPKYKPCYLALADDCITAGAYDTALFYLSQALTYYPGEPEILNMMVECVSQLPSV